MYFKLFLSLVGIVVYSFPLLGKGLTLTKELHFSTVTYQKEIVGIVRGFDVKRYKLKVKENQILQIDLDSKNVYFDIYAPYKKREDTAIFLGKSKGKHFNALLLKEGVYMICVYLSQDEAEDGAKRIFEMYVELK